MGLCGEYKQIKDIIPTLRGNSHVMNSFYINKEKGS